MNLSDVDLRLLRVFRMVVETGGFSQAAIALNVGNSTISTHMADLERRLGFRLCERGRSGFALTDKGKIALDLTLTLFTALDDFNASIGEIQGKVTGRLNIGLLDYMTSVPGFNIASVMHEFATRAPDATLNLQVMSEPDIIRALLDARAHIGIGLAPLATTGIKFEPFLNEVLQVYCGHNHPLYTSDQKNETYDTIHNYKFVGNRLDGTADETRRWALPGDAYGSNLETIAILILSGDYLGFLPTHFVGQWIENEDMRPVRPDLISVPQYLQIATRAAGRSSAPLDEFSNLLKDMCL